jgi:hypothetical protein
MCKTYNELQSTLTPNQQAGLSRIDVPDTESQCPDLSDPKNPKTWKGRWVTVTNPTEIAPTGVFSGLWVQLPSSELDSYHQQMHSARVFSLA